MHNGSPLGSREETLSAKNTIEVILSPLHEAASTGDHQLLEILLSSGADRNARDTKHGNTPLHEAAWRGYSKCVKALCVLPNTPKDLKEFKIAEKKGRTFGSLHSALLGTRNIGGFSALHLAAQNGHNQSCREILLAGCNPDVQNNYGDTPLHTACRYGHAGATRILLSARCDPLRVNLNNDTALHISCAMGRRKLTRILISAANALSIKNAQGETPRDIAIRKNLPEIINILDSVPPPLDEVLRDRSSSGSRNRSATKTTVDGGGAGKPKKEVKIDCTDCGHDKKTHKKKEHLCIDGHPKNWSPYGCHFFPDPRTFPSPKLETLPKEPLETGEQYFLDLAGNIRKGPVGVGNTCYCGPFFRHIEERLSRNKKNIKKYVHKATEKLDNKVQALALKTEDQIEQISRSMLADRIRCDGQRLHLEQWLNRNDRTRATVSAHTSKSRKDQTNTNTLTRCKSLELLEDDQKRRPIANDDASSSIAQARSYDMLNRHEVLIHRQSNECDEISTNPSKGSSKRQSHRRHSTSILDNDSLDQQQQYSGQSKHSSISGDHSKRNSCSEKEKSSIRGGDRSDLEDSNKDRHRQTKNELRLSVAGRLEELLSKTNEIIEIERLTRASKTNEERKKMKATREKLKVSGSCLSSSGYEEDILISKLKCTSLQNDSHHSGHADSSFIAQEMEKITSSLLGYCDTDKNYGMTKGGNNDSMAISPEIAKEYENQKERASAIEQERDHSSAMSGSSYRSVYVPSFTNKSMVSERVATEAIVHKNNSHELLSNTEADEDDDDDDEEEDVDDHLNVDMPDGGFCGFYQNTCFEDLPSSSNNTIKSEKHRKIVSEKSAISSNVIDVDEPCELLSEMANTRQLNELKCRILNGSQWRNQPGLRKNIQETNPLRDDTLSAISNNADRDKVVNVVEKSTNDSIIKQELHPENSDIYALPTRGKVNELVAKIQGNKMLESVVIDQQLPSESSEDEIERESNVVDVPKILSSGMYVNQNFNKNSNVIRNTQKSLSIPMNYAKQPSSSQLIQTQLQRKIIKPPPPPPPSSQHHIMPEPRFIDTRCLIPKDAYFHELPHKNKMRPITDNQPESRQKPLATNNQELSSSSVFNTNARSRNPLPMSVNHNILFNHRSPPIPPTIGIPNFLPTSNNHYVSPYNHSSYQTAAIVHSGVTPSTSSATTNQIDYITRPILPQREKLLANRKFGDLDFHKRNYDRIDSSTLSIQSATVCAPLPLTTNLHIDHNSQQIERDSNNDSGYSPKLGGGSSLGPSPSLSGHTEPDVIIVNTPQNDKMMHYGAAVDDSGRYYVSTFGASSLV